MTNTFLLAFSKIELFTSSQRLEYEISVPEFLHSSSLRFSLDGPETMASPAPLLLLRVKRKATETPVEAIEVTGGGSAKRRKTASAVFRLKSEDADAAAASSRKRRNVGGGGGEGGDAGKEERKRFKVVQADGDAKVGMGMVTAYVVTVNVSLFGFSVII